MHCPLLLTTVGQASGLLFEDSDPFCFLKYPCYTILQVYNEVTRTFKGYSPLIFIIKYWLYSLCGTIILAAYPVHKESVLLNPLPLSFPHSAVSPLVTISVISMSMSLLLFCYIH